MPKIAIREVRMSYMFSMQIHWLYIGVFQQTIPSWLLAAFLYTLAIAGRL